MEKITDSTREDNAIVTGCAMAGAGSALVATFSIITVIGHGIAPMILIFFWPPEGGDLSGCIEMSLAWGAIASLIVTVLVRSRALAGVVGCLATAALMILWIIFFQVSDDGIYVITSIPFLLMCLAHPAMLIVVVCRWRRRDWQISLRDLLLLPLAVPGFAFPWMYYR